MKQPGSNRNDIVALPCACANLRRAARIVTQRYDHALQPAGIKATQFTLLQALARRGSISQRRFGELLGLDSTTLTRTLALLCKKGWVRATSGEDRRELRLELTEAGKHKYQGALRYWRSAQKQMQKALGASGWNQIMEATIRTADLVRQT